MSTTDRPTVDTHALCPEPECGALLAEHDPYVAGGHRFYRRSCAQVRVAQEWERFGELSAVRQVWARLRGQAPGGRGGGFR